MYFNFDDNRPDTPRIPQPISRREVVLLTVNIHAIVAIVILLGPKLPWVQEAMERQREVIEERARAELERQREQARFVFVQPRIDTIAPKAPPRADISDYNREARTVERAPMPRNALPFSRGNSPERIETPPPSAARPAEPAAAAPPPNGEELSKPAMTVPDAPIVPERPAEPTSRANERDRAVGVIADAIRNVRRLPLEKFDNPRGGQQPDFGHSIQFDTKGIEFGPWVARFLAQVRSNWIPLIPQAIMSMHGNVAIGFIVHKDGRITDVTVIRPSAVNAFTLAARNAMLMSNPTLPLPAEYPDDRMPVIVTFYYNEEPPGR